MDDDVPQSKFASLALRIRSPSFVRRRRDEEVKAPENIRHSPPLRRSLDDSSRPETQTLRLLQTKRLSSLTDKLKLEHKPILRKRKLTVPIHLFDNPYFTRTDVLVDARYEKLKHVGSGRFGVVVSAVDSENGERVAIKKVFSAFQSVHSSRHVLREVRLLRYLQHPHIVSLLDIDVPSRFDTWDSVYIVTPLLNMNLRNALTTGKIKSGRTKKRIIAQLVSALAHMHRKGVMHRDVKSLNVLVDKEMNAQFCDLGDARFYSRATGRLHAHVQETKGSETELTIGPRTALQSTPELFLNEQYDASIDLWGIGCIAAEMLHPRHRHLFDDMNTRKPIKTILNVIGFPTQKQMRHLEKASSRWYVALAKKGAGIGTLAQHLKGVDEEALDFVGSLLRFAPEERLTAEQALRHPFLADVIDEVRVESDCNNMFDFRLTEPPAGMSIKILKELVWDEVVSFHPEARYFRSIYC